MAAAKIKFGNIKRRDREEYVCIKDVPPVAIGNCEYYKNRFENYLDRHKDCFHLPPDYYYGPMKINSKTPYVGKQIDSVKDWWSGLINTDVLESPYPKYEKGTPITRESYGYKYCVLFTNVTMPELSKEGQAWLNRAKKRLQLNIEEGLEEGKWTSKLTDEVFNVNEFDNNGFREFAFGTHPDAYNPIEMSSLSWTDLVTVLLSPDIKEWLGKATWEQAWIMAKNMDYKEVSGYNTVKIKTQELIEKTGSKLKEYWNEIF